MQEIEKSTIDRVRALHQEIGEAIRTTLDKAIEIGELLSKQKAQLPHGQWGPWVKENLPFSDRLARDYMRFYERRVDLKTANLADLTDARRLLAAPTAAVNEEHPLIQFAKMGTFEGFPDALELARAFVGAVEGGEDIDGETYKRIWAFLAFIDQGIPWWLGDLERIGEELHDDETSPTRRTCT